jgi:hypothetical protein
MVVATLNLRGVYTAFQDMNDWIMHDSVMHVFFVYTAYQSHEQFYWWAPCFRRLCIQARTHFFLGLFLLCVLWTALAIIIMHLLKNQLFHPHPIICAFVFKEHKGERDLERNGCVLGYKDDESMVLIIVRWLNVP